MILGPALLAAASVAAAPAAAAQAFVDGVYGRWTAELARGRQEYQPPTDDRTFAPELAALYAKDARLSAQRRETVAVDYVALCSCQYDEGLAARTTIVSADARRAMARVQLSFRGRPGDVLSLSLIRFPAGWRIADVSTREVPSLVRLLHEGLDGES